jgi:hypothetical protein
MQAVFWAQADCSIPMLKWYHKRASKDKNNDLFFLPQGETCEIGGQQG